MDGTQNMTSERAYTVKELGSMMHEIVRAAGPVSTATVLIDHDGRPSIVLNTRLNGHVLGQSKCFFGETVEDVHAKAMEYANAVVSPSDAWAIIGAEAA